MIGVVREFDARSLERRIGPPPCSGRHEVDVLVKKYSAERAGLLLVDTFNDLLSPGGKLWPRVEQAAHAVDLLANLRTLLAAARTTGMTVFHVPHRRWREGDFDRWRHPTEWQLQIDREGLFAYGTWGGDWHPDLTPRPGDVIVQEHWGHDGFRNTDLDMQLRQRGIENVILAGMALDSCVAATARSATELGYHVTLVRDAAAPLHTEGLRAEPKAAGLPLAHASVTTEELTTMMDGRSSES